MGRMKQVKRIRLLLVVSFVVLSGTAFMPRMSFAEKDAGNLTHLSVEECLPLAKQGDADAQFDLGVMFYTGDPVPQDYKEAAKWYRKAAEQGVAEAQAFLGNMYSIGRGVPQDYKEAAKWCRKAAEQGDALAQEFIGITIYGQGKGVPQDYVESYAWLNISAAQGRENASNARDFVAKQLSPEALAKAQELSKEYYKKYVEPFQ